MTVSWIVSTLSHFLNKACIHSPHGKSPNLNVKVMLVIKVRIQHFSEGFDKQVNQICPYEAVALVTCCHKGELSLYLLLK